MQSATLLRPSNWHLLSLCRAMVPHLAGAFLVLAVVPQFYACGAGPVGRRDIFSKPELQLAVIEFELFLGVWLLSGKRRTGSWVVSVATFACFAGISLYQGLIGQSLLLRGR